MLVDGLDARTDKHHATQGGNLPPRCTSDRSVSQETGCNAARQRVQLTVISEDADVRMGRKDRECGAIGVMSVAGTSGETWRRLHDTKGARWSAVWV